MSEPNGRTHEPSLREITVQLDYIERLMVKNDASFRAELSERDKRYDQQFKSAETAVTAALAAAEKQTTAAFQSSEKAIVKAEDAQRAYNNSHNDLLRKMDLMIPRPEFDARIRGLDVQIDEQKKEVGGLRESRSEGGGRQQQTQYIIGVGIALAGLMIAAAVFLTRLGVHP